MSGDTSKVGEVGTTTTNTGLRRVVVSSTIGSAVEHYDFFLYAFTAPIVFDAVFFPKLDAVAGLIAVYATFAIGFLARPLGGIVFGHLGDRLGRKSVLTLTLLIMGIASALIGCLPSYFTIGIMAPVLLVALRFLQGFAFGGEYMNAVTINLESSPAERRGFYASWVNASGPIGVVISSGLISLLTYYLSKEQFQNWGWRTPFLLSIIIIAVGTYIRLNVDESLIFRITQSKNKIQRIPLFIVLRSWKFSTLLAILVNMVHSSFQYLCTVFLLGYAIKHLGVSQASITSAIMIANVIAMIVIPIYARLSDRLGRRPLIIIGIIAAAIWFPLYFGLMLQQGDFLLLIGIVVGVGFLHGLIFAPEAAFTAELFPTEVRVSGGSLGKQLGIICGGGIAPLIATSLMGPTTNFGPVIVYFEIMAAMAFVGILFAPENSKKAL
jgi:MHS family shikimate/dehydroshikimate transporter-like MFS transporter